MLKIQRLVWKLWSSGGSTEWHRVIPKGCSLLLMHAGPGDEGTLGDLPACNSHQATNGAILKPTGRVCDFRWMSECIDLESVSHCGGQLLSHTAALLAQVVRILLTLRQSNPEKCISNIHQEAARPLDSTECLHTGIEGFDLQRMDLQSG